MSRSGPGLFRIRSGKNSSDWTHFISPNVYLTSTYQYRYQNYTSVSTITAPAPYRYGTVCNVAASLNVKIGQKPSPAPPCFDAEQIFQESDIKKWNIIMTNLC